MGMHMARHLADAGIPLTVWNRTFEKCEPLVANGATSHETLKDCLQESDALVMSLANGPVVDQVLFESEAWKALRSGSIVVDMSSIPPETAKRHARQLEAHGVQYLDSPVSGGTVGAEQQSLAIMCGGPKEVFDRAKDLLQLLGKPVRVGDVGAGQFSKLCNQVIVGVTLATVCEAMVFAKEGGADLTAVREALLGGFADSRILREHGLRLIERNFEPGGVARNQLKDLKTAMDAASSAGIDLPLASLASTFYAELCSSAKGAELDHSAVLTVLEKQMKKSTAN